ncbi:MAG TPA: CBS domain-containing protein [Hyphomicrobiaceae bacterium]|nr:CBS domain-containing protein [Hyphomicrobiaceae bacterium]
MNVAAILKGKGRSVATVTPDVTLVEVARQLAARNIGAMVITGVDGRVIGIVSERDIIRAIAEKGAECLEAPVSSMMTRSVVSCQESDTLEQLMATMTAGRFRHLPVVENGALVGIVSIGDVVKHHIAEVEMEASALKGYIVAG